MIHQGTHGGGSTHPNKMLNNERPPASVLQFYGTLVVAIISIVSSIVVATLYIGERPDETRVEQMIERQITPVQMTVTDTRNELRDFASEVRSWMRSNSSDPVRGSIPRGGE